MGERPTTRQPGTLRVADTKGNDGEFRVRTSDGHAIAWFDTRADANLFAAAPDVYDALVALLNEHTELINSGDCGHWDAEEDGVVIAARAAIAKAKGEEVKP